MRWSNRKHPEIDSQPPYYVVPPSKLHNWSVHCSARVMRLTIVRTALQYGHSRASVAVAAAHVRPRSTSMSTVTPKNAASASTSCSSSFCTSSQSTSSSLGRPTCCPAHSVVGASSSTLYCGVADQSCGRYNMLIDRRWVSFSSSPSSPSGGSNNVDDSSTSEGIPTTPLSDISSEDLDLAAVAAVQPESNSSSSSSSSSNNTHDHLSDIPGATSGGGKKIAIVFTCTVCSTRSAKKFSEQAYNHGVVLVRCPGCQNLHLIADRLGFFTDDEVDGDGDGSGWDIQKALAKRGDNIVAVTDDNVLELTMADVMGKDKLDQVVTGQGGGLGSGICAEDASRSSDNGDGEKR